MSCHPSASLLRIPGLSENSFWKHRINSEVWVNSHRYQWKVRSWWLKLLHNNNLQVIIKAQLLALKPMAELLGCVLGPACHGCWQRVGAGGETQDTASAAPLGYATPPGCWLPSGQRWTSLKKQKNMFVSESALMQGEALEESKPLSLRPLSPQSLWW